MSPRVLWASVATASPMGQQHYESKIQARMGRLDPDGWSFVGVTVSSLRADLSADVRLPMQAVKRLPVSAAALAGRARFPRADLLHRFDLRLPPGRLPEVVTVHDLPPIRFADEGALPRFAVASARRASGVICPSQFAADEIQELCGVERVWVIPYGLSDEFRDPVPIPMEELAELNVSGRYVVHAAGATQRKNLAGLAGAWKDIAARHPDVSLVLCGPPDDRRTARFASLPRTVMPGRLPLATVARLMAGAAAVVVPSTYEGFGLPALEGMAAGAPVVAANRGALPEVCADAALIVEPDREALAEGLSAILTDRHLATMLADSGRTRADRFDWTTAAKAHLRVYREVLAQI